MSSLRNYSSCTHRAFSLVEVLIALTITATLMTATLAALDSSFKAYKVTTESASTNVVARMVVHRISTMVRNGTDFGPFPADVLDPGQNPLVNQTFMEFRTAVDLVAGTARVVRVERRAATDPLQGPFELWYVESDINLTTGALVIIDQRPLLTGLTALSITLQYDVGPRLMRATFDMTVRPNDFQDAGFDSNMQTPTIRLVTTMAPRRLQ